MRYIRKYNESISIDEVAQNVEDILIDLKDKGLQVLVRNDHDSVKIVIYKTDGHDHSGSHLSVSSYINSIRDTIERLIDYMKSESYNYNIISHIDGRKYKLNNALFDKLNVLMIKFEK